MKIVYCIDSLSSSGGTERVLTTKLNWFASQTEIHVYVVALQEKESPFFPLSSKIDVIRLNIPRQSEQLYREHLSAFLFKVKPDITVAVAGMAVHLLPQIKDGSKKVMEFHYTKNYLVNFVNGLHSVRFRELHLLKMHLLQWKLARTAKRYDCVVGLTMRDVGLWGNPSNMTYIYNPLSFKSKKKSTCHNHRIIAVGSFTPVKGMDQLILAFSKIAKNYPSWELDIYGDGQDKNYLTNLIIQYDIENQVHLHAPVPNIGEKLVDSSIYAFPSRSDGFGLVITEAMECGLPCVAFDCECGPREIVTSKTGIVVPDKDINAFSQALERLITNESLRKSMGEVAIKEVQRFYCDSIMPQWLNLFNKIIQR